MSTKMINKSCYDDSDDEDDFEVLPETPSTSSPLCVVDENVRKSSTGDDDQQHAVGENKSRELTPLARNLLVFAIQSNQPETCQIRGCNRQTIQKPCYHCGKWLCEFDDLVHKEKIADEHLDSIKHLGKRASTLRESASETLSALEQKAIAREASMTKSSIRQWAADLKAEISGEIDRRVVALEAKVDAIERIERKRIGEAIEKLSQMERNSEKLEKLSQLLELKAARRLDLQMVSSDIDEFIRQVMFLENLTVALPTFKLNGIQPLSMVKDSLATSNDCVGEMRSLSALKAFLATSTEKMDDATAMSDPSNRSGLDDAESDHLKTASPLNALSCFSTSLIERRQSPPPFTLIPTNADYKKKMFIPIMFNVVHGDNIALSSDSLLATRQRPFNKSTNGWNVCLTNRPLSVGEAVCVTVLQTLDCDDDCRTISSLILEIGLTKVQPTTFKKGGPWSKPDFWLKVHANNLPDDNKSELVIHREIAGSIKVGRCKSVRGQAEDAPLWLLINLVGQAKSIAIETTFLSSSSPSSS